MNIPTYLDLFAALTFIFLLLSVIVSGINEVIVHLLHARGYFLKNALHEILNDSKLNKNYTEILFDHPLIDRLKKTQNSLPAYISSESFATALIDMIGKEYERHNILFRQDPETLLIEVDDSPKEKNLLIRFAKGVEQMKHSDLKIILRSFHERSKDYEDLKSNIQKWYNDYMDRVSGWYKNRMQMKLFIIGMIISVSLNIDAIKMTKKLYHNQALRTQVAAAADAYIEENKDSLHKPENLKQIVGNIDSTYNQLRLYDLPIGWEKLNSYTGSIREKYTHPGKINYTGILLLTILMKIIGWIMTAVAVSFGAPFWFDLLNKLVDLRKSGKKPKNGDTKK
jgi:hypothetical protein